MTFTAVPWDGAENDMFESQWRGYHRAFGDGLISVGSATFDPSGRLFGISGLEGLLQGAYLSQSGSDSIEVPAPSSGTRYSQVSLEYNPTANSVTLVVQHGGGGANPVQPVPTQEASGNWRMPLYEFGPSGAGSLASLPRVDLRTRFPRIRYATNERQRAILGLSARLGDLVFDDSLTLRRWSGSAWVVPVSWVTVNPTPPWAGELHYAVAGNTVFVRSEASRPTGGLDGSFMATLPVGVRPDREIDVVAWQNTSGGRRAHAVAIEATGRIGLYPGPDQLAANLVIRFTATYPINL